MTGLEIALTVSVTGLAVFNVKHVLDIKQLRQELRDQKIDWKSRIEHVEKWHRKYIDNVHEAVENLTKWHTTMRTNFTKLAEMLGYQWGTTEEGWRKVKKQ